MLERFLDALWLEDGLSPPTLSAYRSDLQQFERWLADTGREGARAGQPMLTLDQATEAELLGYLASRHVGSKASSANRRLTVLRRLYRWALREGLVTVDPTLKLEPAKRLARVPKTLTQAQVERLLQAPDVSTALGLRDRAMLELMYASGLRVSELVHLRLFELSVNDQVLRVMAKAARSAWCPLVMKPCTGCSATSRKRVAPSWGDR